VLPDAARLSGSFNACMTCAQSITSEAGAGDWVEILGSAGELLRCGQIVEVLGGPGRQHFQVRWDENHESMVFPRAGVRIVRRGQRAEAGSGDAASASPTVTGP
jgi:hypothetical protein